jgi:hypothetical protein
MVIPQDRVLMGVIILKCLNLGLGGQTVGVVREFCGPFSVHATSVGASTSRRPTQAAWCPSTTSHNSSGAAASNRELGDEMASVRIAVFTSAAEGGVLPIT